MKSKRNIAALVGSVALGVQILTPTAASVADSRESARPYLNPATQELELNGADISKVQFKPAPLTVSPMALGGEQVAGKCKYKHGGDAVHYKSAERSVSAHGWWVISGGSGCSSKAKVKNRLQAYGCLSGIGCGWTNVVTGKAASVKPGGGSGRRSNARAVCTSTQTTGWRNLVDVDLEWKVDPSGWAASHAENKSCRPGL